MHALGRESPDACTLQAASMAVVRSGLLEKAATSKAAARAPRFMLVPARIVAKPGLLAAATSKAAGGLAKAYPKGRGPYDARCPKLACFRCA